MKKFMRLSGISFLLIGLLSMSTNNAFAQADESTYKEGSVWNVTYVRTHANMGGDYLKQLSTTWASAMDAFVKAGLIKSYKILSGDAFGEDDFNIMLMMEIESFSRFDPDPAREAKFDAIEKQLQEQMGKEKYDKTVGNYANIRDILGEKTFRELHLK